MTPQHASTFSKYLPIFFSRIRRIVAILISNNAHAYTDISLEVAMLGGTCLAQNTWQTYYIKNIVHHSREYSPQISGYWRFSVGLQSDPTPAQLGKRARYAYQPQQWVTTMCHPSARLRGRSADPCLDPCLLSDGARYITSARPPLAKARPGAIDRCVS